MGAEIANVRNLARSSAGAAVLPAGQTRLLYLDNIRVALITAVVVGHTAITYGAPGEWFYHEVSESSTLAFILFTPLLGIGASFLLGLFFLIAAYLTPRACDRKGPGRFAVDRLLRLGLPMLIFMFLFNPLNECAVAVHKDPTYSFWACLPRKMPSMQGSGVSVMWFVELLLVFSLLYALWRGLTASRSPAAAAARQAQGAVPGNGATALFALALGLVTFAIRLWVPVNWWWEPPHLELAHLPQYAFFFVAGLLAYRQGWFEAFLAARARLWRWLALLGALLMPVIAVAAGALTGDLSPDGAGGLNWLSLAYSLWEGLTGVAMTITLLAWFRGRFNGQDRLVHVMAANSYAVYFLHPPIIVLFTLALSGIVLPPGLKLLVVAPLCVALCYTIAAAVRKLPLAARLL